MREDVDWGQAEIASNTRPVIFSGSLQAVIKNHLFFPVLCRMSCTFSCRIMTNECTELVGMHILLVIQKLYKYWFGPFEAPGKDLIKQDFSFVNCKFCYHLKSGLGKGSKTFYENTCFISFIHGYCNWILFWKLLLLSKI